MEPMDVVRAAYAAYNRGDLAKGSDYLAPDLEWVLPPAAIHGEVLRGPAALMSELESEREAFSWIRRELVDLRERGGRVLAVVAASARGRRSGIELEQRTPYEFTVRDGLIVRAEIAPHH
jgi:ketosteroid isomerase-like protein